MATTQQQGESKRISTPSGDPVAGQLVLVFQGGGALGAYQAGVYQALHAAGMEPDWVIGTSIGAINAALLAGNPPELRLARLRAFWRSVEQRAGWGAAALGLPALARDLGTWATFATGIPAFFQPNPLAWLGQQAKVGVEQAAYYNAMPLRELLAGLVDLDYLNAQHMRIAVGAVRVSDGEMRYFDSRTETIGLEHIQASGALPPAFAAVQVQDDYYWDGGVYSNTPIEAVLNDHPRRSSLIVAVDLWSGAGPLPQSLWQVEGKEKDIRYASRANSHLAEQQQIHQLRNVVSQLVAAMPDALRNRPDIRKLAAWGCTTTMHIVRIFSPAAASEDPLKDVDFSPGTLRRRWRAGVADAQRMLQDAPWRRPVGPTQGVVIHAAGAVPGAFAGTRTGAGTTANAANTGATAGISKVADATTDPVAVTTTAVGTPAAT